MNNAYEEVQLETLHFKDDGTIPNSELPVLVYRNALSGQHIERDLKETLRDHGWGGIWINGVYDFHHYHSTAHEFLGVISGGAHLTLGGGAGLPVKVSAGDVLVLPAGTGHKREESTKDFSILGAYPDGQDWDLCKGEPEERPQVLENIRRVARPAQDPLYGAEGPLLRAWA